MTITTEISQTISIESEMKRSYLDYAMSVIVSRAIPDLRDGLKPVHRRILFAMLEAGCDYGKPFKKSARIVGEVMGKYHPHGDAAIYDALVRMAQPFSMGAMLVDGQGNFGSMDGDSPAAMRYTESRLAKIAHHLLNDIDNNTVDFQPNYDGSEREPVVLPAEFPNILVNGAGGIAVGMATNIPPHNLGEIIDATCAMIDNPEITPEEIFQIVPAPDFPTGSYILGRSGSRSAALTGRGSVIMRGKAEIEEMGGGKFRIVINEIPYQVNKARLVERIAELVREKRVEGISDLRDESDKDGVRVVVETKKDFNADVILSQLYAYTPLQTSFGVNCLVLDRGQPRQMGIHEILQSFIAFREEVITRRINFLLGKARDKAHILIGLAIAVANIDEVIHTIRSSADPQEARDRLMAGLWVADDVLPLLALVDDRGNRVSDGKIRFTEAQARAILDMRLQKLTGLESEKISAELQELAKEIADYLDILSNRVRLMGIMRSELVLIKDKFAIPRRSEILEAESDMDIEELIQKEDMVVTVTSGGYIKRVPLAAYRAQKRGGKGRSGMATHEDDATTEVFVTNTHQPVLFFSNTGMVYKLKVYRLPIGSPQSKGKALVNIFPLKAGETIGTFMPLPENEEEWEGKTIMFATAQGNIRRNDLADFRSIMSNGKIAIRLDENDSLVGVRVVDDSQHILLASKAGKAIRFPIDAVRVFKSRTSDGVRAIRLSEGDRVVSISVLKGFANEDSEKRAAYLKYASSLRRVDDDVTTSEAKDSTLAADSSPAVQNDIELSETEIAAFAAAEEFILTVTENGYGKRSSSHEYRITNRGGSGITNIVTSSRNGGVVASMPVNENDQIMLITNKGTLIRCPIRDIRIGGRNTQGVTIFRTASDETVVSVSRIEEDGDGDITDS